MDHISYYFSIFLRRLPWFLIVATIITAVAGTIAFTLPPAYVSQMRMVVESPQIPEDLALSTVQTPALERLQIIEQRLLTRNNLLDIARRLEVLRDLGGMNPDQIVAAMRARTTIRTDSGRNAATLMTISFEAADPRKAAGVLNQYLNLIQQEDSEFRRSRAGETLNFFTQEVKRLSEELDSQGERILEFKQEHADALPESLDFRMDQRSGLQERRRLIARDLSTLKDQKDRLIQFNEMTGGAVRPQPGQELSPEEERLRALQAQLDEALTVYSNENPRVKMLQARIAQAEKAVAGTVPAETPEGTPAPSMFELQMAEFDRRIGILETELQSLDARIASLDTSIERTPEVSIELEELERRYKTIQGQYDLAEERLSRARTGDLIETRSRGQRISVIEQPAVPTEPTKPNRMMIAGGGSLLGILAGLTLIVLLEMLNSSARRPEDLVKRFGITPITTIPYIRTRGQLIRQRSLKMLLILCILIGIPAIIYAVHIYYLPLDLLADRMMDKLGVRW